MVIAKYLHLGELELHVHNLVVVEFQVVPLEGLEECHLGELVEVLEVNHLEELVEVNHLEGLVEVLEVNRLEVLVEVSHQQKESELVILLMHFLVTILITLFY